MSGGTTAGRLVTLEGGEGAGKSTTLQAVAAALEALGHRIVATREPGGTRNGEAVRALVLAGATDRWSAAAELMLMNAARLDHCERVVRPALARGAVVICDRFVDSTRVYQGLVGGLGLELVDRLHRQMLGLPWPDRTLLLDVDPSVGLARRAGAATRFEARGQAYHERIRAAFLDLAAVEPSRFQRIDASGPAAGVQAAALTDLTEWLATAG